MGCFVYLFIHSFKRYTLNPSHTPGPVLSLHPCTRQTKSPCPPRASILLGGWVIDKVNKLYGRLEGGEYYGEIHGQVRGPFILFSCLPCSMPLFSSSNFLFYFFFCWASPAFLLLSPLHLSFLHIPPSSPQPSFLTPPRPLPSSPQSTDGNEEEVLRYCK